MGGQVTTAVDAVQAVAAAPADTSVQVLNLWALVLLTFTNLGATFWNILSGPSRRNATDLKAQAESLERLDRRVGTLETAQQDMPKQKDFHELEMTMTELKGAMGILTERLKPLEAVTDRLHEWVMEQNRK